MQKLLVLFCLLALPMTGNAQQEDNFKVAILMFDQVQIIDFAAPYEVFGQAGFEVYTVSKDSKPIMTAMGLNVSPAYSFENLPTVDAVLVPGGDVEVVMNDRDVRHWLQKRAESVQYVLSVCTGAFILAEAHLLDGLQATTFYSKIDNLQQSYPAINVVNDRRYADNDKVITSAGLSSGIDAALQLVSDVQGLDAAKTIAHHIEYDWHEEGATFVLKWPISIIRILTFSGLRMLNFLSWHPTVISNIGYVNMQSQPRLTAGQLRDIVQQGLAQLGEWQTVQSSTENQLLWQHDIAGHNWQLKLTTEDNESAVQMTMKIEVYQTS